ncbi:MAG TPA: hypothetical protein VLI90_00240, partial [Tepidisphaeraceae bacterium]|nr:hypothetical protein [Tepidisphaeraceae bacterium]
MGITENLSALQAQTLDSPTIEQSQTISTSFTGATLSDTGAFPPDSMGDVGPTQYIVAVNGRFRSFNKTTAVADGALNANPDTFFSSVLSPVPSGGLNFTSDPRIRYDRGVGRWFIVMIDVPSSKSTSIGDLPNRVMIAVSSGATITGTGNFTFYSFQGGANEFADYPTLGIDASALYIGSNIFSPTSGAFINTNAYVVRKSSILSGGPIVMTPFTNLIGSDGPNTPQGVDDFDAGATQGYFIGPSNSTGKLVLRRVSDPGGTPTLSSNIILNVAATAVPLLVPHLGNTKGNNGRLDAVDDRLMNAVIRNGHLWTAQAIAVDNTGSASGTLTRDGVRWYDITNLATTPTVNQFGTVSTITANNLTTERNYWIPSIMVSGQGDVAMGFSAAGSNEHINAATTGRLAGDPLNTMAAPVLYTNSTTAYNPSGDTGSTSGRRWGDYSYTSIDPSDDMTMWTIQEYCNATNSYAVQVVKLLAPLPATPASASGAVTQGASNVNVVVTGNAVSGSGFFDPG